jgi:hypothetical protein
MKKLLPVLLLLLCPATAAASTPTLAAWRAAGRQEATRECIHRQNASPTLMNTGVHRLACVRDGAWKPVALLTPGSRNVANDVAAADASFTLVVQWGREYGTMRLFVGTVHMHIARYVWRVRGGVRVLLPVIAVERPIGWRRIQAWGAKKFTVNSVEGLLA